MKKPPKAQRKAPKTSATDAEVLPAEDDAKNSTLPAVSESGLLPAYMKEVLKVPLLTPEQEKALAIRVHDHKDADAARELAQANLRFVVKIAFEYARYGAKVLDLVQEGNVGLLRAIRDFNPYKDVRLTTYAVYWIRSYIQDYLIRNWSMVRIGTTNAQKKLFYRLKKEQERLEREGLKVEPKLIANNLNVDESDVKLMQERLSGGDVSLSTPLGSESDGTPWTLDSKVADDALSAESQIDARQQAELFHKALGEFAKVLDERDREIFESRLLSEKPPTLQEIGDKHGFTKERARQIEEKLKSRLKDFLAEKYPDISMR